MKRQSGFGAILVYAIAAAAASAAATETMKAPEPTGFGKAKFGMSVAEVRKLYPQLHPSKATEEAVKKGDQVLLIFELENQSVGSLKPCGAQLRFFKGELYEVQFRCPDRAKVAPYLQKTYGLPTKTTENAAFWMGKHSAVSLAPRSGAFGFSDLKRAQAMQSMLWASLQQPQATAGATPPAAATPAAPAHE